MSFTLNCIHVSQAANNGASGAWLKFSNSSGLESFMSLASGVGKITDASFGSGVQNAYKDILNRFRQGLQCGDMVPGWSNPVHQTLCFQFGSDSDREYYDNNLAGKELEVNLIGSVTASGVDGFFNFPVFYFKNVLPVRGNAATYLYINSAICITDIPTFSEGDDFNTVRGINNGNTLPLYGYNEDWGESLKYGQNFIKISSVIPDDDCTDLRTSEDGQNIHFIISDGESNVTELDVPFLLSEGSTQEKAIKTYMNDTLYNSLINLYNLNQNVMARCYFNAGIVRSSCTVRLVGKVYGQSVGIKPSITPPFVQFDYDVVGGTDVDILKAEFEPCSDKPVRITEDLRAFLQGLNVHGDLSLGFNLYQVLPYKVVIENCTSLSDFCCDDSTPSDSDSITIEPTDGLIQIYGGTQGGSSGGDDVNIQCICDNLNSINNTLLAFKDSNQATLEAISNTLSELDINVDNTCVCENLQTVSDSIIAVKDSIDNKELSVVNNNTVQPPVNNVTVQPPVNNVTVQPPVNNVSVPDTQLENIANNTRSLNNIFDELYNMNVVQSNIEGYFGNIRDSLECDKKGLACVIAEKTMNVDVDLDNTQVSNGLQDISDKLSTLNDSVHDSLFNSDDESNLENINKSLNTSDDESKNIVDVIKDKEMGTNIDVEVSPADDVNINRVYYTNQRNGENNL